MSRSKSEGSPLFQMNGWALIDLNNWHHHLRDDGCLEAHRSVCGYCRAVSEDKIGLALSAGREYSWIVMVYASPDSPLPFAIIPGCKVYSAQIFTERPAMVGFCTNSIPLEVDRRQD